MPRPSRLVPFVIAVLAPAFGCYADPPGDPGGDEETSGTSGTSGSTGEGPGAGPISTVTGVTSSGSVSSDGSSGSGSDGDDSTGAAIDAPPTVELLLNGSAAPEKITKAGTQVITAIVGDDHGLDRVEILLEDEEEPFAVVALGGVKDEVVEVGLPIYNHFTPCSRLRAVVYDGASQATMSAEVKYTCDLPLGGEASWEVVGESVFASKALAVGVDSIGDVIAVGEQATAPDGLRSRMVIAKYRGDTGEEVWRREWPTQKDVGTPLGRNVARGVAVDAYDNVYVTGEVDPDGDSHASMWVGKYTFDGLMAASETDALRSRGNGVVIDVDGRVFVVGYQYDDVYDNVARIDAFDVALEWQWSKIIAVPGYVNTRFYGAAIDQHGEVVVVGSLRLADDPTDTSRGLVTLYRPDGKREWIRPLAPQPFEPLLRQRLFSVVVNDDNEYVCAGRRAVDSDPRALMQVQMGDDGEERASQYSPGMSCGDPSFYNDNDVCGVAGAPIGRLVWSGVRGWETDDIEVKQTGAEWPLHYWQAVEPGDGFAIDRGIAVAVDADGYVAAAGYQTPTQGGSTRWWVSRRHP